MEYFVGSFITFVGMYIFYALVIDLNKRSQNKRFRYGQSHIHSLMKPLLPPNVGLRKELNTQAVKHLNKVQFKVIIVGPDAFWIKDNVLYTAKVTQEGVDKDTTAPVDTMAMNSVELDKMVFIVDQLRNGLKHDSGGSGNQ